MITACDCKEESIYLLSFMPLCVVGGLVGRLVPDGWH
jgi:hypothetical protein